MFGAKGLQYLTWSSWRIVAASKRKQVETVSKGDSLK